LFSCCCALSLCYSLVLSPSCSPSLVLSLPRFLALSLSCSFAHLISISRSFTPSPSHSLAFSLSNSVALSLSLYRPFALSSSRSLVPVLYRSFALSLFRSFALSLSGLSLCRAPTLPLSRSLALVAVLFLCSLALSCFRSLVLPLALSQSHFLSSLVLRTTRHTHVFMCRYSDFTSQQCAVPSARCAQVQAPSSYPSWVRWPAPM